MRVHGEIEYIHGPGQIHIGGVVGGKQQYMDGEGVKIHSDICPPDCDLSKIDDNYREYIHAELDEWLNKSNGTGVFYLKQEGYTVDFIESE